MALLPPKFLTTVVAIGVRDPGSESTRWTGTGFIYGEPSKDHMDRVHPFLLTNRHVLESRNAVVVKMNRLEDLNAKEYEARLKNDDGSLIWTPHPGGLDVAALPILGNVLEQERVDVGFLTEQNTVSLERAHEIGVSEGDGIFALGFPMGLTGYDDRNFVMVKQGCIARIQDWLSGHSRHILVDSLIFPGNSGGPIFLRPSSIAIEGTKPNNESLLLGMVKSYIPYRDVAVSTQTQRPRVTFEENSGIAQVIPGDAVIEAVKFAMQNAHSNSFESESAKPND